MACPPGRPPHAGTIAAGADNGAGGSLPAKVLSIRGVIGDIGGGLPSVSDLAASDLLVDL